MLVSLGRAVSIGVNIENIEEKGRARACLEHRAQSGEMQPSLHNEHSPASVQSPVNLAQPGLM